jgi:hypothetical protein
MAEFQVRSDAVDVEQIMRQIRARIREKRGVDYTEQEIRELASVKLEKFLDPRGVRSNLVEDFRRNRVLSPAPPPLDVKIETLTVTGTHRSALSTVRRLLAPVMKLFINPNAIMHEINKAVQTLAATFNDKQTVINTEFHNRFRQREEMDSLYYEVIHNLVVELTRLSIENNNLKMRVESLSSRMDFDERRARALESVVQYKPAPRPGQTERPQSDRGQGDRPQGDKVQGDKPQGDRPQGDRAQGAAPVDPQRAGLEPRDQGERGERRRRRRRRRRPGQNLAGGGVQGPGSDVQSQGDGGQNDGPDDDGPDDTGSDNGGTEPMTQSNSPVTSSSDSPLPSEPKE